MFYHTLVLVLLVKLAGLRTCYSGKTSQYIQHTLKHSLNNANRTSSKKEDETSNRTEKYSTISGNEEDWQEWKNTTVSIA
jgi:hypothetical protein